MLKKSSTHFSSMRPITIVLVVKVDKQPIPQKFPPALHSKLRQG